MTQTLTIRHGDCVEVMKTLPDGSVGAVITDPPYLISFMSKTWDTTEEGGCSQEWHLRWLREAFRVLRPGGTAKVFSATRTFHRLAAAMEEAGFVLKPEHSLEGWGYGSGFPKSLNVSKALDKMAGVAREVVGQQHVTRILSAQDVKLHNYSVGLSGQAGYIPLTAPATDDAKLFEGYGTALKPAWEVFLVGGKPF